MQLSEIETDRDRLWRQRQEWDHSADRWDIAALRATARGDEAMARNEQARADHCRAEVARLDALLGRP